ncbi:MAG: 1,2-phenylacetyl-CoA epoxidase subunit PaaC [Paracoccaceae bacterium]
MSDAHFTLLLRLADDHLILGHRLSEWCGHAPMLEEDLSLPNIALDLIGQSRALYTHAGEIEGKGRDEDALAYLRHERGYANALICERPNGDFGHTMLRQLYFSLFMEQFWQGCAQSSDKTLSDIANKAIKETTYHIRHSAEWVIRLGDGTQESHERMKEALDDLAPYLGELFESDETTKAWAKAGLAPDPSDLCAAWEQALAPILDEATLGPVSVTTAITGGRAGKHTEDMGHLLSDLQYIQRTHPGQTW